MTFEQIKSLSKDKFEVFNDEIWKAINNLSFNEIGELLKVEEWHDDNAIQSGLCEFYNEKAANLLYTQVFEKLTPEQFDALKEMSLDKDLWWDYIRGVLQELEN